MRPLIKLLGLILLHLGIALPQVQAQTPCPDCSRVQALMEMRMAKLDSVVKLRQSYLLGEIEQSKPAIAACLAENQAVTSRSFILWVLNSMAILAFAFFLWKSARIHRKAIKVLSGRIHSVDPSHPSDYQPSQFWNRLLIGGLIVCFVLTQFAALLL